MVTVEGVRSHLRLDDVWGDVLLCIFVFALLVWYVEEQRQVMGWHIVWPPKRPFLVSSPCRQDTLPRYLRVIEEMRLFSKILKK